MASIVITDGQGHEPAIVLPGHYLPVGSQPVSTVTSSPSGEITLVASEVNIQGALSAYLPAHPLVPSTDDVMALEIRAVTEKGFWRCGRFWPREPVHVFASDDPDADNAANNESCNMVSDCFISHEDAARLKAEPMLVVTVLDTVAEQQ
ncbi:hypothetical protein [Kluyvera sp. Awk 3]|uniref:hypothetical protein n=1 Tax=Kluyvera sp. Awk 3 TaxID=2963956 RepID=UPI002302092E|nr:hypothetical protein [Kluyvera sp. Awk 3]MDA8488562.1 hypothetical protein [Kluyvera sp. Awk 3]